MVVVYWAVEEALCALYCKIALLAEELVAAQWDLMLWRSNLGRHHFVAVNIQEAGDCVWLQVKIPQGLDSTELDVLQVDNKLKLSLECRERVTVPGYCDFLYSSEQMESSLTLPSDLTLRQTLWNPATHLYTITLNKGLFARYEEYAPASTRGVPTLPQTHSRSYSLA